MYSEVSMRQLPAYPLSSLSNGIVRDKSVPGHNSIQNSWLTFPLSIWNILLNISWNFRGENGLIFWNYIILFQSWVFNRLLAHIFIGLLFGYLYKDVGNAANSILANYVYLYGSLLLAVYTGKMPVTLCCKYSFAINKV